MVWWKLYRTDINQTQIANSLIKLRMEIQNVPNKQQPDQRARNNTKLQKFVFNPARKFRTRKAGFSWPLNKNMYLQYILKPVNQCLSLVVIWHICSSLIVLCIQEDSCVVLSMSFIAHNMVGVFSLYSCLHIPPTVSGWWLSNWSSYHMLFYIYMYLNALVHGWLSHWALILQHLYSIYVHVPDWSRLCTFFVLIIIN